MLGLLPDGVRMKRSIQGQNDLLLWFTKTKVELEKRASKIVETAGDQGLWVIFPKKDSGVSTDLTQAMVVKVLGAAGAKQVKSSSLDKTWSMVRFSRKKPTE